jgi:hypothetical protein
MTYELKKYPEIQKFHDENTRIGFKSGGFSDFDIDNIWICELYQNNQTQKYSLLIITDLDESHIVFEFE